MEKICPTKGCFRRCGTLHFTAQVFCLSTSSSVLLVRGCLSWFGVSPDFLYHHLYPSGLQNTILRHWPVFASDPALALQFKDPPLFFYIRGLNSRNKLVWANIKEGPKQTLLPPLKDGNYPCGNFVSQHIENFCFDIMISLYVFYLFYDSYRSYCLFCCKHHMATT